MSWEEHARCNSFDPDLFFTPRARAERRAKAICSGCPVSRECLSFAVDSRIEFGVWGGLTGNERRALATSAGRMRVRTPALTA